MYARRGDAAQPVDGGMTAACALGTEAGPARRNVRVRLAGDHAGDERAVERDLPVERGAVRPGPANPRDAITFGEVAPGPFR